MYTYAGKELFVRTSLKSLLFDIDKNIIDIFYTHKNGEEIVTIIHCNYSENVKINVTTDSFLEITRKILNSIEDILNIIGDDNIGY